MPAPRSVLFTNAHAGGAGRIEALVAKADARGVAMVTLHPGHPFPEGARAFLKEQGVDVLLNFLSPMRVPDDALAGVLIAQLGQVGNLDYICGKLASMA